MRRPDENVSFSKGYAQKVFVHQTLTLLNVSNDKLNLNLIFKLNKKQRD
jgi:hypothetical protein